MLTNVNTPVPLVFMLERQRMFRTHLDRHMNLLASLSRRMLLTICIFLAACATQPPTGKKDLLDFLKDGATQRDDVLLKLGEPSTTYESMRILAYRLRQDEAGYVLVGRRYDWIGASYSLILVFDDHGTLRQHALVEVKPR